MKNSSNQIQTLISVVLSVTLLGIFFVVGVYFGYNNRPAVSKITSLLNKESPASEKTDFDPYWKVWNIIETKHPGNDSISDQDKVWGSISGLVSSLNDPYSIFLPPEKSKIFEEDISGKFSGIGIEVGMRDNVLTVVSPLKGTPGDRAGLKPADQILKIDDTVTTNMSLDEAVMLIRGEEGTDVVLTILSENAQEPEEVVITRATIEIPTIDTVYRQAEDTYIITLYNFSANAPELFEKALRDFSHTGSTNLVIDLRGNPGGYLSGAIDIASFFLPTGKVIVTEGYNDPQKNETYRSRGYTDIINLDTTDIVILINGGSASASEIVAGALHEHGIATLIGSETYGKGSVQELIPVTKDTSLKLTVAKWFTPNGRSISDHGLTPDYEVEYSVEEYEEGVDPQLERALEILGEE